MIRLHFVGDGPRDHATVPHLVATILHCEVNPSTDAWARLHGAGRGYAKKLAFAERQARDSSAVGLVATIDRDNDRRGERLSSLMTAREDLRAKNASFPVALGEAIPHAEAWFLDDPQAVRETLALQSDFAVPTVSRVNSPKEELATLQNCSSRAADKPISVLEEIARRLDPDRCVHAKETGFQAFQREIEAELRPLVPSANA